MQIERVQIRRNSLLRRRRILPAPPISLTCPRLHPHADLSGFQHWAGKSISGGFFWAFVAPCCGRGWSPGLGLDFCGGQGKKRQRSGGFAVDLSICDIRSLSRWINYVSSMFDICLDSQISAAGPYVQFWLSTFGRSRELRARPNTA